LFAKTENMLDTVTICLILDFISQNLTKLAEVRITTGILDQYESARVSAARKAMACNRIRPQLLAMCMGLHPRLGASSPVLMLNQDVVGLIARHLTQIGDGISCCSADEFVL
jgi:hypothetical protein